MFKVIVILSHLSIVVNINFRFKIISNLLSFSAQRKRRYKSGSRRTETVNKFRNGRGENRNYLRQRSNHKAGYGEKCIGRVFAHQLFKERSGQEYAKEQKYSERRKRKYVKAFNTLKNLFIFAHNKEHMRCGNTRQNQSDCYNNSAYRV